MKAIISYLSPKIFTQWYWTKWSVLYVTQTLDLFSGVSGPNSCCPACRQHLSCCMLICRPLPPARDRLPRINMSRHASPAGPHLLGDPVGLLDFLFWLSVFYAPRFAFHSAFPISFFFQMRALSGNVICFCTVTILFKDSLRKKLSPSVRPLLSDNWLWMLLWDVALNSEGQCPANGKERERGTVLNGGKAPCVLICFFSYLYHCYYS